MTPTLRTPLLLLTTLALLSLSLAAPAVAKRGRAGGEEPTESQQAVHDLRKQIGAEELLVALNLSDEQAEELAALVAGVVSEREAKQAERTENAPELEGLLERYLAEVRSDGEPSAATIEALTTMREANGPDREARRAARTETREALAAILDEEQMETMKEFRPMAAVRPERGVEGEDDEGRHHARRARRGHRGAARILFSPEMLAVLQR